jgi:hypothetical protein
MIGDRQFDAQRIALEYERCFRVDSGVNGGTCDHMRADRHELVSDSTWRSLRHEAGPC